MTGQIKKAIGLRKRVNRVRYEQALVEGPQAVRELLANAPELIRDIYVTDTALEQHADINRLLLMADPYTHVLPEDIFAKLSDSAQGLLAVIDIPDEMSLDDLFEEAPELIVCAIELQDPGNLGTIIRSADACGADAVILGRGSVEAMNPKVLRSTAGSAFHVPIIEDEDISAIVSRAKASGLQIFVADGGGEWDLGVLADAATQGVLDAPGSTLPDLRKPTLWLLGNEARGFTDEQRGWADAVVQIPMWGKAESLNVAMATTLCLHASATAQNRGRTPR